LTPGATYTDVAFDLSTDKVTLDCRGATLTGAGTCIDIHDATEVEVVDCVVRGCDTAIAVHDAPQTRISSVTLELTGTAVQVDESPDSMLSRSTVCFNHTDFMVDDPSFDFDLVTCNDDLEQCAMTCP
jgi:hypothetical protein